jgi:hypothetical protein
MRLTIEVDQVGKGRFFAAVRELPGVTTYAEGRQRAVRAVVALALRTLAEQVEEGELAPITLARGVTLDLGPAFTVAATDEPFELTQRLRPRQ